MYSWLVVRNCDVERFQLETQRIERLGCATYNLVVGDLRPLSAHDFEKVGPNSDFLLLRTAERPAIELTESDHHHDEQEEDGKGLIVFIGTPSMQLTSCDADAPSRSIASITVSLTRLPGPRLTVRMPQTRGSQSSGLHPSFSLNHRPRLRNL